jgi:hypothetical protein
MPAPAEDRGGEASRRHPEMTSTRLWPTLLLLLCGARTAAQPPALDPGMPVLTWWEERIASLRTSDPPTLMIPAAALEGLPPVTSLHAIEDGSALFVCTYPKAYSYSHVRLYRAQPPGPPSLLIDLPVTEVGPPCWAGASPGDYTLCGADGLPGDLRFLASAEETEPGGLIVEDTVVLDGLGRESARFSFDPDLAIPSYFPYSIAPSRTGAAHVIAAMFRARRQSNGPPPSWAGIVHVAQGQAGPVQILRPGSEDLSPPASLGGSDRSWRWETSRPRVLADRSLVAYRATLRIWLGAEHLAIAALRVCDPSGHSRLIDFVAWYHTEGPHYHEYVWTFDAEGRPVERWNRDWLEDELHGWGAELAPCVEPQSRGVIYVKRGALWRAEVRRG